MTEGESAPRSPPSASAASPDLPVVLWVGGGLADPIRTSSAIRRVSLPQTKIDVVDQMAVGSVSAVLASFRDMPMIHLVHSVEKGDRDGGYRLGLSLAPGY